MLRPFRSGQRSRPVREWGGQSSIVGWALSIPGIPPAKDLPSPSEADPRQGVNRTVTRTV